MPERPFLTFPEPALAEKGKRFGRGGKFRTPNSKCQTERLAPQFQRLQQAMDQQRAFLQASALGLQPEMALVLETIGPVQDFINAVKRIAGLEWLAEFEIDDIPPAHGFEDLRGPQKMLSGQLFLVMTDQRALHELQNLFINWKRDPDVEFSRGLAPLKNAFSHLHTIRPWDSQDRIRDTGLLEDWQARGEHEQQIVPFEAELWFRQNEQRRQQSEAYVRHLVSRLGGEFVQQCIIPEIAYHGILGRIGIHQAVAIMEERDVRLLQCEDIMYLRPVGQCAIRLPERMDGSETAEEEAGVELPEGEPIVAMLDGLPLAGHRLLDGRLILDDPDDYERNYQARERVHGTAMASLICRGDLNEGHAPISRPVYVRPILQPHRAFDRQFVEQIPEGVLPVDLLHRAVRRLFEGEGGEPPAAPSVRVVNISVCDRARPFDRGVSAWARLLDWLSWKHNVLFVVSAGNHTQAIELDIPRADFRDLPAQEREQAVLKALAADTRHRRLLAPAESLNCLTVGASHADASTPAAIPNHIDPFTRQDIPSTISAHGPGYRRSLKPDIFLPGGRQFLTEKIGGTNTKATLQTATIIRPPGQRLATPGPLGELDRTFYTRGTSNAAALASRGAAILYDVITDLRSEHGASFSEDYDSVLLKALLVHSANWAGAKQVYESIFFDAQNSRTLKDYIGRFLGYGMANLSKVMFCTDQRVTVLGMGELEDQEAHEFQFPLPPSLSAVTERRRLTITLAWLSPVNCARQNYRIAHLWFDPKNNFAPARMCADHRAVTRGTVQHEVLEGVEAVDFQDGDMITIKVSCRADAGDIPNPVRYALVVTLEVAEGIAIPVYLEVRDRLRVRIPVTGGGARGPIEPQ
jgi:hypothetical protein